MSSLYGFLSKNGLGLAFGVGTVLVVLFLISIGANGEHLDAIQVINDQIAAGTPLATEQVVPLTLFDPGFYGAYALVVFCALAWVLFEIINLFLNPKNLIRAGISLVILMVLLGAAYSMAPGDAGAKALTDSMDVAGLGADSSISKYISMGINAGIWLVVISFITIVLSEIANLFR